VQLEHVFQIERLFLLVVAGDAVGFTVSVAVDVGTPSLT
jgi:hypothetical protein